MKRLLLVMLLLGAPAYAGDLGPADLAIESIPDQQLFEKGVLCGGPLSNSWAKCIVEFKDGLLMVNSNHSISPHQVRHFSWSENTYYTIAKRFEIIYLSKGGRISRAEIAMVDGRQTERFYKAFLAWLNLN